MTEQLRELEADGIIERKVYLETPPKVEYSLTSRGRSMIVFLNSMSEWGERYIYSEKIVCSIHLGGPLTTAHVKDKPSEHLCNLPGGDPIAAAF